MDRHPKSQHRQTVCNAQEEDLVITPQHGSSADPKEEDLMLRYEYAATDHPQHTGKRQNRSPHMRAKADPNVRTAAFAPYLFRHIEPTWEQPAFFFHSLKKATPILN